MEAEEMLVYRCIEHLTNLSMNLPATENQISFYFSLVRNSEMCKLIPPLYQNLTDKLDEEDMWGWYHTFFYPIFAHQSMPTPRKFIGINYYSKPTANVERWSILKTLGEYPCDVKSLSFLLLCQLSAFIKYSFVFVLLNAMPSSHP